MGRSAPLTAGRFGATMGSARQDRHRQDCDRKDRHQKHRFRQDPRRP